MPFLRDLVGLDLSANLANPFSYLQLIGVAVKTRVPQILRSTSSSAALPLPNDQVLLCA